MADDDDDYMADLSRFLPTESVPVPQGKKGKSSGDEKKKIPGKEKKKVAQDQQKRAEEEQRKEGLGSAIPSSNIGFKMLQQMGYSPGAALGKHGQGLLEPVNIDLKRSRTGLGRDSAAKEEQLSKARRVEVEAIRNKLKEKVLRADFQERSRDSWQARKISGDYKKASATHLQLEESCASSASGGQLGKDCIPATQKAASVNDGVLPVGETEDKPEEEEEEITLEMLQAMLQKLRDQYNYCLYCGYQYESAAALSVNCPGLEEDAH